MRGLADIVGEGTCDEEDQTNVSVRSARFSATMVDPAKGSENNNRLCKPNSHAPTAVAVPNSSSARKAGKPCVGGITQALWLFFNRG